MYKEDGDIKLGSSSLKRQFMKNPKPQGQGRKLKSQDEFLMLMIRLCLNLLIKDLAQRFNVSSLVTYITTSWLRAAAKVLKSFIFIPSQGTLNLTKPPQFDVVRNLHSIIDGTEIFIQTPKDHRLQKIMWSQYKHHNTVKLLVSVAPNSTIVFVSNAYSGNISDKELTNRSNFLDLVEPYSSIMADKGFNISNECIARRIELIVPPGKRGKSQMSKEELKKTKFIAKMRIIVEQVIRQLKTFRILASELPISSLSQIDDIVTVCAALINLKKSIY